jgi:hypothetical protein
MPTVARVHSFARRRPYGPERANGSHISFRSAASRGFTDQGLEEILLPASPATIARDRSFAPTRSTRAPLVARPSRFRLGNPIRSKRLQKRTRFALSPARQVCTRLPLGPPLAAPREGNRDTPRPRCLPSTVAFPKEAGSTSLFASAKIDEEPAPLLPSWSSP